jgi:hypothetical protein
LVQATSGGDVSSELAGLNDPDSSKMNLKVRNKTEQVWELKIEVGTRLEPEDGNVQQMVVTKEIEVHLEPHDYKALELEVSCLDISKAAPSSLNTKWKIVASPKLAQFIRCANGAVDDLKIRREVTEEQRPDLIQLALWDARGATHNEWIDYYEHYHQLSLDEAERAIEEDQPRAKKITGRCPAL